MARTAQPLDPTGRSPRPLSGDTFRRRLERSGRNGAQPLGSPSWLRKYRSRAACANTPEGRQRPSGCPDFGEAMGACRLTGPLSPQRCLKLILRSRISGAKAALAFRSPPLQAYDEASYRSATRPVGLGERGRGLFRTRRTPALRRRRVWNPAPALAAETYSARHSRSPLRIAWRGCGVVPRKAELRLVLIHGQAVGRKMAL